MIEEWKDVTGYEGLYQVSNYGNVKSLDRTVRQKTKWGYYITKVYKGKILKKVKDKDGYNQVNLCKRDGGKMKRIARLVAEAFIPNPDNKPCVDHIIPIRNGGNDTVDNLRWVTHKENDNNEISLKNKSEALKGKFSGKKHPFYGKKRQEHSKIMSIPIIQINEETGELQEWESTKKCSNELNCSEIRLGLAVNGKNRNLGHKFKGYLWYKKEEYDTSATNKTLKIKETII